jgi:hypothetical protein
MSDMLQMDIRASYDGMQNVFLDGPHTKKLNSPVVCKSTH